MFCSNCGKKLDDNEKFCSNCGKLREDRFQEEGNGSNVNNAVQKSNDERVPNILSLFSLILGFGIGSTIALINVFIPNAEAFLANLGITGSFPLIGLVIIIITRIKYPKNKFSKIVLWIYIIFFIIGIIAMVLFLAACINLCGSIPR